MTAQGTGHGRDADAEGAGRELAEFRVVLAELDRVLSGHLSEADRSLALAQYRTLAAEIARREAALPGGDSGAVAVPQYALGLFSLRDLRSQRDRLDERLADPDLFPGARRVNERVRAAVQAEITRRERAQEHRRTSCQTG